VSADRTDQARANLLINNKTVDFEFASITSIRVGSERCSTGTAPERCESHAASQSSKSGLEDSLSQSPFAKFSGHDL
jgi:hypothetical protein